MDDERAESWIAMSGEGMVEVVRKSDYDKLAEKYEELKRRVSARPPDLGNILGLEDEG